MFSDGANDCLFDATNERTVLMYGRSKTTPPNSRDTPYHQGYPRAGEAMTRATHCRTLGRPGRRTKLLQAEAQRESAAIRCRQSLARHRDLSRGDAGVFAFVRLIYRHGETGEMPFEAEYGILNGPGQFRVVIFPNR